MNKLFNGLPLYTLDSNTSKEEIEKYQLGLYEIAFTGDPAIGIKGVALNKSFKVNLSINNEKRIVAGPAMIPDYPMYRKGDEQDPEGYYVEFSVDAVREEYEKFLINTDTRYAFNDEHTSTKINAAILESWIIESDNDKSKFYGFEDLPLGTVFTVVKVLDDEYWNKQVKANGKFGFSIQGNFIHRPVKLATDLFHPNCRCEIVDGKLITEEDVCDYCKEQKKELNLKEIIELIKNMDNDSFLNFFK